MKKRSILILASFSKKKMRDLKNYENTKILAAFLAKKNASKNYLLCLLLSYGNFKQSSEIQVSFQAF